MKVSIKFAQETADMVTFTEEILMENIIFCEMTKCLNGVG